MVLRLSILLLLFIFNLSSAARFSPLLGQCSPAGYLRCESGPCNTEHESSCCQPGQMYPQYSCSPDISGDGTQATLTINSFAEGGDGGGPSKCDNNYHSDDEMVVALSTGWYDYGSRCLKKIRISANGISVLAKVVDECDSMNGCNSGHDFQPPCANDIVDASPAVWEALEMNGDDVGSYTITWSDV
ncbi:Putative ripening-related protein 2 [Apostasia shenzhenica]|uniref:Ripening-related protein 2 n=1 Tax=Apostasia shenzhenica TaxID=1088818 RepID=A0A2I0AC41_9ASPA|nr:Putative ripening-related protein 2 [Apostasia shenzhenica]